MRSNLLVLPTARQLARLSARDTAAVWQHLNWMRLRGLAPAGIDKRREVLARIAPLLPVPLLDATADVLAAWRAGLAVGDATFCSYLTHLRGFYGWAVSEGLIAADPAARIPRPRLPRRLPRPVADGPLIDAVHSAPKNIRPWLVLAGWAGLRAKEIALLRRECVLDSAEVPLLIIAADATKGRTERTVPMSPFVLDELQTAGMPGSGWMFARRDGKPGPNQPNTVSHIANGYLHSIGIAASLHQLRHRFGTQAYRATRDLRAVQELLGHTSPSTTAGYAAYDSAAAIEAVTRMPMPSWWQPAAGPGRFQ